MNIESLDYTYIIVQLLSIHLFHCYYNIDPNKSLVPIRMFNSSQKSDDRVRHRSLEFKKKYP